MLQGKLSLWASRWLQRRGLEGVAAVLEKHVAESGDVAALHAVAKRALVQRDTESAFSAIERALALDPNDASLWCTLGATYRYALDLDAAHDAYQRALVIAPNHVQTICNLGELSLVRDDPESALGWFDRALILAPAFFEARLNKVVALFETSRYKEAESEAERLIVDFPDRPEPYVNLGNVLVHTGKAKKAVKHYQKALLLRPGYEEAHFNLATLLGSRDDLPKAIGYLERQVREKGESIHRLGLLATAHQAAGNLSASEKLCRRILDRQPENITALVTLASCISTRGDAASALPLYQQVVEIDPSQSAMDSNVLFELTYLSGLEREAIFRRHLEWAQRHEAPLLRGEKFSNRNRDLRRKLRVGYVSGDFCGHPVGFLLRDVLRYHNREQYEIFCFSMLVRPDDITLELQSACDHWHDIFLHSDEEFVDLVKSLEIDVLVDLSGHTAFSRLLSFARRPAPVQATWIGYFHSTGMSSIDYFISDPFTTPPGGGQLFSENVVYLPKTRFCYGPPPYAPDIEARPTGELCFGSFNRLAKITDPVIDAWCRILTALPHSRLILKAGALKDDQTRARLIERFAGYGVSAERLELRAASPHSAMLSEYGDVDLALDTFPFNGGMTTLEALWMGVPVLTIEGDSVVSRQTYSVLANIGMSEELATPSVDAYVARAIELADSRTYLAGLRGELRTRIAASSLRQPEVFTADLEALYREMWIAWCEGRKLPSGHIGTSQDDAA